MTEIRFGPVNPDDEWLGTVGPARTSRSDGAKSFSPIREVPKSAIATMRLDEKFLPVSVDVSLDWRERIHPQALGSELFAAYERALWEAVGRAVEAGQTEYFSTIPSPRQQLLRQLEASTFEDLTELRHSMFADHKIQVGSEPDESGESPVIVNVDGVLITAIKIWPEWARGASRFAVASAVLYCADELRRLTLSPVPEGFPNVSDVELVARLESHIADLARKRVC